MLTKQQIEDLKKIKLSANFNAYELVRSVSYPELVIYPSDAILDHLRKFAETVLQPIRNHFGPIHIDSGWRNKELNKRVGGVENSVHQINHNGIYLGVASDLNVGDYNQIEMAKWIYANTPAKTVIIYRDPKVTHNPFIHTDIRLSRRNKVLLEKTAPHTYVNFEE